MRKIKFAVGNFYHVYNRGVDKRIMFFDDRDFKRFILYLDILNDPEPAPINLHRLEHRRNARKKKRGKLVKIVAFCLMPNHFHILLEEIRPGGISQFMQKLGTAYTMYFNTRYKRSGRLFQGTFKAVKIESEIQLEHITRYIHLNPLDLFDKNWRDHEIKNWHKAKNFLLSYKWSSLLYYIGEQKDDICEPKDIMRTSFNDNKAEYLKFLKEWAISYSEELENLILE